MLPPLLPPQLHDHGPVPNTVDAVPVVQRLVVGADDTVVLLGEPQMPDTGVGVGESGTVPPIYPVI